MKKNFVKSLIIILTGLLYLKPKFHAVISNLSKNFLAVLFATRFLPECKSNGPYLFSQI